MSKIDSKALQRRTDNLLRALPRQISANQLEVLAARIADQAAHTELGFWLGRTTAEQARHIIDAVEALAEEQDEDDQDREIWWYHRDHRLYFRRGDKPIQRVTSGSHLQALMELAAMWHGVPSFWIAFAHSPIILGLDEDGSLGHGSGMERLRWEWAEPKRRAYELALEAGDWAELPVLPHSESAPEIVLKLLAALEQVEWTLRDLAIVLGLPQDTGSVASLARHLPAMAEAAGKRAMRAYNPRTGRVLRDPATKRTVWQIESAKIASQPHFELLARENIGDGYGEAVR